MAIVERQMGDRTLNYTDDLKAAIKATLASITPTQRQKLKVSMPVGPILGAVQP